MDGHPSASAAHSLRSWRLDDLAAHFAEQDEGGPVAIALHREWANPIITAYFTVPGEPRSKARPRLGAGGHVYTPAETKQAEEEVGWRFRAAGGRGPDADTTFGVFAVFFCGTRQRRDVDNMVKLIFDGLNGIAWADDSQVTEVSARLVRGVGDEARSEVIVYETVAALAGGLTSTKPCEHCQNPIRIYPSTAHQRFCSNICAGLAKRSLPPRSCEHCGKEFQGGDTRRFCSQDCASTARRLTGKCAQCGREIAGPKSWNRKFCSVPCAAAWHKGKPREARA